MAPATLATPRDRPAMAPVTPTAATLATLLLERLDMAPATLVTLLDRPVMAPVTPTAATLATLLLDRLAMAPAIPMAAPLDRLATPTL